MENLVEIAEDVLTSCLAVKTGEEVLIITDDSRQLLGYTKLNGTDANSRS